MDAQSCPKIQWVQRAHLLHIKHTIDLIFWYFTFWPHFLLFRISVTAVSPFIRSNSCYYGHHVILPGLSVRNPNWAVGAHPLHAPGKQVKLCQQSLLLPRGSWLFAGWKPSSHAFMLLLYCMALCWSKMFTPLAPNIPQTYKNIKQTEKHVMWPHKWKRKLA